LAPNAGRRLVIVRHAKSSWPDGVDDLDRPLSPRGLRDALALGRELGRHTSGVDAAVVSPARRCRDTWGLASAVLADPPAPRLDRRVYEASGTDLLAVVRELPATAATAVLVGHSPGTAELVRLVAGGGAPAAWAVVADGLRTAALAVVTLSTDWAGLDAGDGTLVAAAVCRA